MRKLALYLLIATLIACHTPATDKQVDYQSALSNQLGNAVLWFQQSAEMEAAFLQSYQYGKMVVSSKIDTLAQNSKTPAVVLDLDETVLDNSPYEARLVLAGNNYSSNSWKAWCLEAQAEALPGAADFLKFINEKGIQIFYISNRKDDVFEATLKNLKDLNLPQADSSHLLLRTGSSDKSERRAVVEKNHQILLFVGDNLTDYKELFANRQADYGKDSVSKYQKDLLHNFLVLPNPMYGEWESAIYGNDFSITAEQKLIMRLEALDTSTP